MSALLELPRGPLRDALRDSLARDKAERLLEQARQRSESRAPAVCAWHCPRCDRSEPFASDPAEIRAQAARFAAAHAGARCS